MDGWIRLSKVSLLRNWNSDAMQLIILVDRSFMFPPLFLDILIKSLEMIPIVEFAFGSCSQSRPIRKVAETLGGVKLTIWYIKKKKCTGELSNTKRPGQPQKTTKAGHRILSLVLKKRQDKTKKPHTFHNIELIQNTLL